MGFWFALHLISPLKSKPQDENWVVARFQSLQIRTKEDGSALPVARVITSAFYDQSMVHLNTIKSTHVTSNEGVLDPKRSVMLIQWSQFLEQDLAKTVPRSMGNGKPIECCSSTFNQAAPRYRHPACAPLIVPDSDVFYRDLFVKCLNYVRSALAVDPNCKLGAPNQVSAIFLSFWRTDWSRSAPNHCTEWLVWGAKETYKTSHC